MLTADTALEVSTCLTTISHSILDKLTHTLLVDSLEWVAIENLVAEVVTHEGSYVVT
jgi:hypothetical protein